MIRPQPIENQKTLSTMKHSHIEKFCEKSCLVLFQLEIQLVLSLLQLISESIHLQTNATVGLQTE